MAFDKNVGGSGVSPVVANDFEAGRPARIVEKWIQFLPPPLFVVFIELGWQPIAVPVASPPFCWAIFTMPQRVGQIDLLHFVTSN